MAATPPPNNSPTDNTNNLINNVQDSRYDEEEKSRARHSKIVSPKSTALTNIRRGPSKPKSNQPSPGNNTSRRAGSSASNTEAATTNKRGSYRGSSSSKPGSAPAHTKGKSSTVSIQMQQQPLPGANVRARSSNTERTQKPKDPAAPEFGEASSKKNSSAGNDNNNNNNNNKADNNAAQATGSPESTFHNFMIPFDLFPVPAHMSNSDAKK